MKPVYKIHHPTAINIKLSLFSLSFHRFAGEIAPFDDPSLAPVNGLVIDSSSSKKAPGREGGEGYSIAPSLLLPLFARIYRVIGVFTRSKFDSRLSPFRQRDAYLDSMKEIDVNFLFFFFFGEQWRKKEEGTVS